MDATVNLDHEDAYLSEFAERAEAGAPSPLDRANSAFERAEQAATILGEDFDAASLRIGVERVADAARFVAQAIAQDRDELAEAFATHAEAGALALEAFDSARFEGLNRPRPFRDERGGAITRWKRD